MLSAGAATGGAFVATVRHEALRVGFGLGARQAQPSTFSILGTLDTVTQTPTRPLTDLAGKIFDIELGDSAENCVRIY